ncbi:hypothetical protein KKH39_01505 [Patescibacteria group bacterium]|nr:hypothetical protein [Patescibacteria group bacterium]
MSTAVVSQARLFWRKLGWWQALTIVVVLAAFFIALHLTGQKELAGLIAALVVAFIMFVSGAYAAFTNSPAPLIPTAVLAIGVFTVMITQVAILLVGVVGLVFIMLNLEVRQYGIKKRVVWLSSTVEFVAILLPILLA